MINDYIKIQRKKKEIGTYETLLYKRNDWIDSVNYTYDIRERLKRKGSAFFDWYMYYDGDNPQSGVI